MGSLLDRRRTRPTPPPDGDVRFVPAPWFLPLILVARTVFTGARVSRLGIAGLVWSITPRPVKIAAAGLVAAWMIVVLGALAAIALLVLQLS